MSKFKGTRGEVFEQQEMIQTKDEFICDLIGLKFEHNANLIVDAFKVRQQINCELSELLEQRNEMLAMLIRCDYWFYMAYKNIDIDIVKDLKQLIKKVKDNE